MQQKEATKPSMLPALEFTLFATITTFKDNATKAACSISYEEIDLGIVNITQNIACAVFYFLLLFLILSLLEMSIFQEHFIDFILHSKIFFFN